jgi:hypothetical protein
MTVYSILSLFKMCFVIIIIIENTLLLVKLNSFAHLRALLVLYDRGVLAHITSITGRYSCN